MNQQQETAQLDKTTAENNSITAKSGKNSKKSKTSSLRKIENYLEEKRLKTLLDDELFKP